MTVTELKLADTYRADRHADRLDAVVMDGEPVRPACLDAEGARLWDATIPELVTKGIVATVDTASLTAMCMMWSLFLKAERKARRSPCDKAVRSAVTAYWSAFDKAASRCGLTPLERSKLPHNDAPAAGDAITRYFGRQG